MYTVRKLVDALDLASFYAPYVQQGSGNLPYAPAMMVKILVYGYATGFCRPDAWRRNWKRMWPSACWREGICPSIPPFLNFGGGTARISGRCWWRWCSWRGTWAWCR